MVGRIWGQTRHLDDRPWEIWGQTRCLGARVRKNGDRHDIRAPGLFAGTCQCTCRPRYGDRHDVRYTDRERSTCNVQLATFNGVTERAQGGRNMGTDTAFGRPAMGNMGTDTLFGRPGQEERGQARYSGARAFCRDLSMHLPAQIRGQTRCPVHRSGTFNVQRSTRNFQRGDRKGVWWAGYGDRHGIWTTGHGEYGDRHAVWAPGSGRTGTGTIFGRPGFLPGPVNAPAGPDTGTDTMPGMPIGNVQRATFNSQLSTG